MRLLTAIQSLKKSYYGSPLFVQLARLLFELWTGLMSVGFPLQLELLFSGLTPILLDQKPVVIQDRPSLVQVAEIIEKQD